VDLRKAPRLEPYGVAAGHGSIDLMAKAHTIIPATRKFWAMAL
jgi:hypothetical protein